MKTPRRPFSARFEPIGVTLASPHDITVRVPGVVEFRVFGPRAFPRAAALYVDAEVSADCILGAGSHRRHHGPADRAPVHSEGPDAPTSRPSRR